MAPEPPHFRNFGDYAGSDPAFYDPDALPWVSALRRDWAAIRAEFEDYAYRRGRALTPNFVPDPVPISGWLGITFCTLRRRHDRLCREFPRTMRALEGVPGLASAFINLLEPHASLPPHFGDTNIFYRVHLGLIVPGGVDGCGMEVDGERTGWGEGEVFVFNDARRHRVWNDTDRPRVVMVCDVIRPEFGAATARRCAQVYGSIVVTFLQTRVPSLRRLPRPLQRAMHELATLPFHAYLAVCGARRRRDGSLELAVE